LTRFARDNVTQHADSAPEVPLTGGHGASMPTIVIVDDRVTNRDILAKLASSLDEQTIVRAFEEPTTALAWIAESTPDLVITDYKMPTMDGAEFTRRLRRLPLCSDVPVIVVTVYEDRDFRYKALEAGATDFLLSPLDHFEFRARAHNLLTLRKQQQIIKKRTVVLEQKLKTTNYLRKEELRESEEKLRLVTNTVPAMICVTDKDGLCIFVNNYQAGFFGTDPELAIGKSVAELFGDTYAARHLELDRRVFDSGETISGAEESFANSDGVKRAFLTTKAPLFGSAGEVANVVTVSVDITERTLAETALQQAKEAAEAGNRAKTEFLASMSHELRTPLNAVIGFADVMRVQLLGPIGNPKYLEYAQDIRSSAEHLLRIINDMLDVSTIESGRMELVESDVDTERLLEDVVRLAKGRAESTGIEIAQQDLGPLPHLRGDERRLKQILVNVLSNAVKFTPSGGKVAIAARLNEAGDLCFEVTDNGIGIAQADLPIAMSSFGRIENPVRSKYPGTGLGLPLAIELTKLHGGTLDIVSTVGKGTTVTIVFPAERTIYQPGRAGHAGE